MLELVHMIVFGLVLFELGMASLWPGVAWVVALVVVVVIVVMGLPWSQVRSCWCFVCYCSILGRSDCHPLSQCAITLQP